MFTRIIHSIDAPLFTHNEKQLSADNIYVYVYILEEFLFPCLLHLSSVSILFQGSGLLTIFSV